MSHFFTVSMAFLISASIVPIVRHLAIRCGFVNKPKDERWNHKPIALMGGVAIFLSFVIPTLLMVGVKREIIVLISGGTIIFVLGLLDDIFGTYPLIKFMVQILIALAVAELGIVSKLTGHIWIDLPLTMFWIVGLTNALNLLDNMDGLSSGISIISAMGIFVVSLINGQSLIALSSLALVGACLGFLIYNFKPAKIFMGDCGSLFLGYTLSGLAILSNWQQVDKPMPAFLSSVFILGAPIFDTTLVTILRLKHRKMPWQGGRDHSSHRLVSILNNSEVKAVLSLYVFGLLSVILGIMISIVDQLIGMSISTMFFLAAVLFGIRLSKVKCYEDEVIVVSQME